MYPGLQEALDAELLAIRADPVGSIGFGDKAYLPYEPVVAHGLITAPFPEVTAQLAGEIRAADDPVYALALLQVLGRRADDGVDPTLLDLLGDPGLRATSAYLLGRMGYRGYPVRARDSAEVEAGLRAYLADDGEFEDPFYREQFRRQDFVIAALVRILGPDGFEFVEPRIAGTIGYALPRFDDDERAGLLSQLAA